MSIEVYVLSALFIAAVFVATALAYSARRRRSHFDKVSLASLENETKINELEEIERRYQYEMQRANRLSMELLNSEISKDELSQQLAERTMEMEDAIVILEQQSATIAIQSKVDAEEKKRLQLLETVVQRSDQIIKSFIEVRKNGNGRADDGRIVKIMSKCFSLDELDYLCRFSLGESAENMHDGGTLIDRCMDVYMWCERHGRLFELMAALRSERPNEEW